MDSYSFLSSVIDVTTVFSFYLILYVLFLPFEALFPAERGHTFKGRAYNVLITFIFLFSGVLIANWCLSFFTLSFATGVGNSPVYVFAVVFMYIFLFDFFFYWYHRAEHTFAWLWPVHELHHTDTQLNITTSYRTYWLERPLQAFFISIPVSLTIGSFGVAYVYTFSILLVWEFFTHANLRLHLYFLTPIICGPQLHRIHHSRLSQHQDKNFAQYFPVIDKVFGTYYTPAKSEFPPTGVEGVNAYLPLYSVIIRPFALWRAFINKKLRK